MSGQTEYAGIDYGLGRSNIDHTNGIRYGVISQHAVGQAWYDSSEAQYAGPNCPKCGDDARAHDSEKYDAGEYANYTEGPGCADYACDRCCYIFDSSEAFGDDPIGFTFEDSEYTLTAGEDGDIFVVKSPYYTHAQFCSPCAPGAGHLENPCEHGPRTYALGHEWFEDGKAPYPLFKVADDTEVVPDGN